jgi:tetratricopeptide (TPR) repeat protein
MAADFRLCPACGTRNKLKWEFCVKCGESLQGVAAGTAAAPPASAADDADESFFDWRSAATTALALGVAAAVGLRFRPEPAQADPSVFATPARSEASPPVPPKVEDSRLSRGLQQLYGGDPRGALQALAAAAAATPNDPMARRAYGQALWLSGQSAAGVTEMAAAARLAPQDSRIQADTARMLLQMGRPAEAIPFFEAALRVEPDSPGWLGQLAQVHMDQGNAARAAELLERAASVSGGNAGFLQDLGVAYQKAGNAEGAAGAFRRALQSDPRSDTTRALLAEQLLVAGRADEAIDVVRQGLEQGSPALYRALGSLLERSGRAQEAAEAYREYARRSPQAADAGSLSERASALEGAPAS